MQETWVQSLVGEILWRRKWQSTPVLLPGKSHGQRSLVGYSPWGRKESDTTKRLHSLHYIVLSTVLSIQDSSSHLTPRYSDGQQFVGEQNWFAYIYNMLVIIGIQTESIELELLTTNQSPVNNLITVFRDM